MSTTSTAVPVPEGTSILLHIKSVRCLTSILRTCTAVLNLVPGRLADSNFELVLFLGGTVLLALRKS